MKKSRVFLIAMMMTTNAFTQGDSQLNYFKGGSYKTNISFSNSIFMGVGSRVGGMGGDYGGQIHASESILWNPANLAFIRTAQLSLDFKPELMFNPAEFVDISGEIRSSVDRNIEDFRGPGLILTDEDYPTVDVRLGERTNLGTGSFAFRFRDYVIAGALFQPVRLSMDLMGSGFEAQMETLDAEDPSRDVTFYSSIDLNMVSHLKVQGVSLGAARKINNKWTVGASAERLSGSADAIARFQVEGIMLIAGNERAFNDPGDPWQNNLHSTFRGSYSGSSTSLRLGTTYKLLQNFGVGLAVSLGHKLRMSGALDAQRYELAGLNMDAGEDEDLLDVTEIDLDEPTKTVRKDSMSADFLEVRFPGSLAVGLSGKSLGLGYALSYVSYAGRWSYSYEVRRGSANDDYYHALRMKHALRLGLDLRFLRIGAGVGMGEIMDDNSPGATGEAIIVPSVSLATGFSVGKRLSADVLLLAVPSGVGKITFHYTL